MDIAMSSVDRRTPRDEQAKESKEWRASARPAMPDQRSRVSDTTFSYVWIASLAPSIRVCRARACLTMSMSVHRLRERCDYEHRMSF